MILRVPSEKHFGDLEVLLGCFWGGTGGLGAHLRGLWDPIGVTGSSLGSHLGSLGVSCRGLWGPLGCYIMQLAGFWVHFLRGLG